MIYRFSCPHPCNRVFHVDADNDEDAIWKILKAGALICRNIAAKALCDRAIPSISPLPDLKLQEVVRLMMQPIRNQGRVDFMLMPLRLEQPPC
jgi:hypothetical protein